MGGTGRYWEALGSKRRQWEHWEAMGEALVAVLLAPPLAPLLALPLLAPPLLAPLLAPPLAPLLAPLLAPRLCRHSSARPIRVRRFAPRRIAARLYPTAEHSQGCSPPPLPHNRPNTAP